MTERTRDGKLILTWPWSTSWPEKLLAGYVGLVCLCSGALTLLTLFSDPLHGLQMIGGFMIMGPFFFLICAFGFNQSELIVDKETFLLRYFPLWWGEPRRFEGVRSMRLESYRTKKRQYRIYVSLSDGREVVLTSGLDEEQAKHLVWRLQAALPG